MQLLTGKGSYGYSRGHRILEVVAISLFFAAVGTLTIRIVGAMEGVRLWLQLGACVLGGYFLADLLSGIVHWAGDTVGTEQTPFLGQNFVKPFRHHHVQPKAMCQHDFVETNGNNCIVSLPILGVLVLFMPATPGLLFWLAALVTFATWFIFCTNQFHKWAHAERPPVYARVLQRLGLILRPDHHDIHHASPHDTYYCITVGWMNPLLHKVRFFRILERVVGKYRPGWLHLEERRRPVR